ncbi:Maob [Symbiodinium natans]|uniref:Amine oxidase n=1 Tax=Symbiodinium natans TaxID=878477 RepID=A0A812QVG5_9DINO|nr:Maob [Symbiodinium natans]
MGCGASSATSVCYVHPSWTSSGSTKVPALDQGGHVNCLIIGAGFSGLSCANEICKHNKGLSVHILEASDRIGGRCVTDKDGVDLGGQYVGYKQHHVLRLAEEMGTTAFKIYKEGEARFMFGGPSQAWDDDLPPLPGQGQQYVQRLYTELDKLAKSINFEEPEQTKMEALDKTTFRDWCQQVCPGMDRDAVNARNVLENMFEGGACADASQFSVLGVAYQVHSEGGLRAMMSGGIEDHKIAGGMGGLCERLWKSLPSDLVSLKSPVKCIDYTDTGSKGPVKITYQRADGSTASVTADYVVLSTPPNQTLKIEFQPPLPQMKAEGWSQWPMGQVIKTVVQYKTPWWRNKGLSGEASCDVGPVTNSMDDNIASDTLPALLGFIPGRLALQWGQATSEERKNAVLQQYAQMYGDQRAITECVCYKEKNWADEPYIGGGYGCVALPGATVKYPFDQLFAPIADEKIRFAGSDSSDHMGGYVDGAIKAGEREGRNVLVCQGLLPKSEYNNYKDPGSSKLIKKSIFKPGLESIAALLWEYL